MDILEKTLSEKTEAVYREITKRLVYPVKIEKMDPENQEEASHPVAMDTGKKEFLIKLDSKIPFLRTRWSET